MSKAPTELEVKIVNSYNMKNNVHYIVWCQWDKYAYDAQSNEQRK